MFTRHKAYIACTVFALILIFQTQTILAAEVEIKLPLNLVQSEFEDFSEEIGLAISYLPMAPAEPLGILGWDIGIEVTVFDIDQSIWDKATTGSPPGTVLFPKIHLQKGLPFGVDLGAVYTKVPGSNIKVIGGELKWAVISGNAAMPAIAIRGSYTKLLGVDDFELETIGADASISKGFAFVTPYAGYGLVRINSKATASSLNLEENISTAKPFAGLKISLALINFVFEADFGQLPMYTARVNVGF